MKVYKGTDENMVCHGKQYVLGKMEAEENAKLCKCGLHACEMPLDVLRYYTPNRSRYFEAEADDVSDERSSDDSKIVSKKMTLKADGCAICCVERGEWDGETYPIIAIKAAIVDGDSIKPDTWYMLQNGEFTEVREDG